MMTPLKIKWDADEHRLRNADLKIKAKNGLGCVVVSLEDSSAPAAVETALRGSTRLVGVIATT